MADGTLQFNPNSYFGGKRIDARPRNVSYIPGTGSGTGLLARRQGDAPTGLNAFYLAQRDKTRSMADINREASIGNQLGLLYNPNLGGYLNDSMYNRSGMGYQNPYAGMGQPQAPAMTEPQMEWARKAQEKQTGAGALGKMGEKMAAVGPYRAGYNFPSKQPSLQDQVAPAPNPYMSARQQNIANAKEAGEFDKVRADYNKRNEGTGMVMDEEGNISRDPTIAAKNLAEEKAMMSDFNRGIQRSSRDGTTSFTSPYGRGSISMSGTGPGSPQSMVRDDFGNMVPMRQFLERKNYVQGTQGMTGDSSVLGGNAPARTSILPPNPIQAQKAAVSETPAAKVAESKPVEAAKAAVKKVAKATGGKAAVNQKPLTPNEQRKLTLLEAKYGAQGLASDEMREMDAERADYYRELQRLQQVIEGGKQSVVARPFSALRDSPGVSFQARESMSANELAKAASRIEELTRLIKENQAKSQELGNKRKIPAEAMKEWLELSSRAGVR